MKAGYEVVSDENAASIIVTGSVYFNSKAGLSMPDMSIDTISLRACDPEGRVLGIATYKSRPNQKDMLKDAAVLVGSSLAKKLKNDK